VAVARQFDLFHELGLRATGRARGELRFAFYGRVVDRGLARPGDVAGEAAGTCGGTGPRATGTSWRSSSTKGRAGRRREAVVRRPPCWSPDWPIPAAAGLDHAHCPLYQPASSANRRVRIRKPSNKTKQAVA
jgi:hypothetical protein